jgi:hypothetical protein
MQHERVASTLLPKRKVMEALELGALEFLECDDLLIGALGEVRTPDPQIIVIRGWSF